MIRFMTAAPSSGSGKTVVTLALLKALMDRGIRTSAFKCGPDYIDPMFHRSVLGVPSRNLDLFLCGEERLRENYRKWTRGYGAAVTEGVMGFYDGLGGTTDRASAWHLADTLDLPVVLVLRAKGASLTLAAEIRGIAGFREKSHVAAVILNECSPQLFQVLAPVLERESGIPVVGCLPKTPAAEFPSRHLGLYTAGEIEDLRERISSLAESLAANTDLSRLFRLLEESGADCGEGQMTPDAAECGEGTMTADAAGRGEGQTDPPAESCPGSCPGPKVRTARIGVARDEAFCFLYEETLETLEEAGAELVFFSPVHDTALPEEIGGLYLPGGYPELHAKALAENESMRNSVAFAVKNGMPTVAECGGFMYLGKALKEEQSFQMAGVLPGTAEQKGRLVRFGYADLTAETDSLLFRSGETVPVHEFHYWDSTENGDAFRMTKPLTGRSWRGGFAGPSLFAAFPHLYMAGRPEMAERFVEAARKYSSC